MKKNTNIVPLLLVFVAGTVFGVGGMRIFSPDADENSATQTEVANIGRPNSVSDGSPGLSEVTTFRGELANSENSVITSSAGAQSGSSSEFSQTDTVDAIQSAVRIQSTKGKLEYLSLLQNLTPEDAPRLLGVFRELSQQGYKVGEYDRLFWERWAEIDGEAASSTMFERDKRFKETHLSKLAISTWARNDPNAASAWHSQQEDIPLRDGMLKGLLEGMAVADPDFAQSYLGSANLSPEQISHGYSHVARQKSIQEGLDVVGDWYSSFSEDDPNYEVVTHATAQIYAQASFADSLNWANALEGSPEAVANTRQQLHWRLAHNRPDGLLKFLGSDENAVLVNGVSELTERAVVRWLETTPYAMGKWLQKNDDIRNYDMVVTPFVEQIALENLQAAQAWAETIRDSETRKEVTLRIVGNQ